MKLLVVGGGPHHDTSAVTAVLADALPTEFQLDYTEDLGRLREEHLLAYDVLVLYLLQYSGTGVSLHEAARHGIYAFLAHGRGLMALHCGHASFDDWPGYGRILGGIWEWGRSDHAPFGPVGVHIEQPDHPITRGVNDFTLQDELYHSPTLTAPIEVLAGADHAGKSHPLLWTRRFGNARVHYNALGHAVESARSPEFQRLFRQGVLWVGDCDW